MKAYNYSKDFLIEVMLGNIPGHTYIKKFGRNEAVGGTIEAVSIGGVYQMPSSPASLEILSDDADDTSNGTGVRTVSIQGIDDQWNKKEVTVSMAGATPVPIPGTWYRVFRVKAITGGSYANTAAFTQHGTLTLRVASGGATWTQVDEDATDRGKGQSQIGCYTVQKNNTALLLGYDITIDGANTSDIFLFQRQEANIVSAPFGTWRLLQELNGVGTSVSRDSKIPLAIFPQYTDIVFMGKSTGGAAIAIDFELLLIDNNYIYN